VNWKNVLHLVRIDVKSGRLLRGKRLTRFRESRVFTYVLYGGALVLGLVVAALAGMFYNSASAIDPNLPALVDEVMLSLFVSLPTLVLIYSLVLTMMQQIQRSGIKSTIQAPYWLPITWGEHTLASILANLIGIPLVSIMFIAPAMILFSTFTGQVGAATATVLAVCAAAFMASAVTEVFRVLQVRFIGAVYKSTGRAAIWVRFVGSLLLFLVFYIVYFYVVSGTGGVSLVQTLASGQSTIWFVPFVWLAMTLYSFLNGLILQGIIFAVLSIGFIAALFYLATSLNGKYGLYEPPAITVSRGVYAPKIGILGRLGFSTTEAALIRKDLKAFTRRRELMVVFIIPIVIVIAPIMQSLGQTGGPVPTEASLILAALIFLFPSAMMATMLGSFMIGEEGETMWRIYSSPISPKSLVKSKYFFVVFFSLAVLAVTGTVGFVVFHPSLRTVLAALLESVFLVFALGSISLSNGIRGADFTEVPRPRMIRTLWSFINLITCFLAAIAILAPFVPYLLSTFFPSLVQPFMDLYVAVVLSSIIAAVVTLIFYRISVKNAEELLRKAET
jgi:hypothetical protein